MVSRGQSRRPRGLKARAVSGSYAALEGPLFHGRGVFALDFEFDCSEERSKSPLLAQRAREKWGTRICL